MTDPQDIIAALQGDPIPSLPEWRPTARGDYRLTLAEDEHGNLIRWLLVGRTYVIDEGTVYKWWGWLTDLRLNEGQDNPWDIAEWTELGNDPIELMHRIRARESVGSS